MIITLDFIESFLLDAVPRNRFSLSQHDSANGICTSIEPTNINAAQIRIWLNPYGTCDILFGRAFALELELSEGDLLVSLVNPVIKGRFAEVIWSIGKTTLYSKSAVTLDHSRKVVRSGIPFPYPWWWKHFFRYKPYSEG